MFSKRKRGELEWGFKAQPSWRVLTLHLILTVVFLSSTALAELEHLPKVCANTTPVWVGDLIQPELSPLPNDF